MTTIHSKPRRVSAIGTAIACMLLATSAQAGKIEDTNLIGTTNYCGSTKTIGQACVGAWNLGNVKVEQVHSDGTPFPVGSFDNATGAYAQMTAGDSFVSSIMDAGMRVMAKLTGKVWPIGEPTGIKAVNRDAKQKNGKPGSCLINTAYLGKADTATQVADAYLDSDAPEPVLCDSNFQTHKRFKIAMQPASVADANGDGNAIDMVFNVADETSADLRDYQVFSKINNYTDMRLKGYKIVVGRGTGDDFQSATELGINDRLKISLGIGEGKVKDGVAGDIFDEDGLATFSHGLFGPKSILKDGQTIADVHFPNDGFFDNRPAGFEVTRNESMDTIRSGLPLSSAGVTNQYTQRFGDWLPSKWQPKGIFFDTDGIPSTDAKLVAYWDGKDWLTTTDVPGVLAKVSDAEFATWKGNRKRAVIPPLKGLA